MEDLKAEVGIPLPDRKTYPFLDVMQPGESLLVPLPISAHALRAAINYRQERYDRKYATKTIRGQGVRVWRVK